MYAFSQAQKMDPGVTQGYFLAVFKSTDSGASWTRLDVDNEVNPVWSEAYESAGVKYFNDDDNVVIPFQFGTKFRIIFEQLIYVDYLIPGDWHQVSTLRIYTFDCATELWESGYISCPGTNDREMDVNQTIDLLIDATKRGANELVCLYRTIEYSETKTYIWIYNFDTASFVETALQIFPTAYDSGPDAATSMIWDGTYLHFFSAPQATFTGDAGATRTVLNLWHVTMDSSGTFGSTIADLLTVTDAAWIDDISDPSLGAPLVHSTPCIYNGKIYKVAMINMDSAETDFEENSIVVWYANIGEENPTWEVENILLNNVGRGYDTSLPRLFVSNGILHCIFRRTTNYAPPDTVYDQYAYVRKLSGGWETTPTVFFSYEGAQPATEEWDYEEYGDSPGHNYLGAMYPIVDFPNPATFALLGDVHAHVLDDGVFQNYYPRACFLTVEEEPCDCNYMY